MALPMGLTKNSVESRRLSSIFHQNSIELQKVNKQIMANLAKNDGMG